MIVWGAGLFALAVWGRPAGLLPGVDALHLTEPYHASALNFALAPGARWDAAWYLHIAKLGYFSKQSSAFFPLYPLLIGLISGVTGSALIIGIAISVAAGAAALALLYRLALLDLERPAARLTVVLVALSPMALFLSAVYTESLYLLLSVGAIYAARLDRWTWAGLLGALASAARPNGVLLFVPLCLIYLYGPRRGHLPAAGRPWWQPRYRITPSVGWLALVPAGLLAYMGYLLIAHGDAFASYEAASSYWGRSFDGPFGAVIHAIRILPSDFHHLFNGTTRLIDPWDPLNWNAHNLIDLAFFGLGAVGLVLAWGRMPFAYVAYAFVLLLHATSFPSPLSALASVPRYELSAFPLFMAFAIVLAERPRLRRTTLAGSVGLLALFSGLWGMWAWVA